MATGKRKRKEIDAQEAEGGGGGGGGALHKLQELVRVTFPFPDPITNKELIPASNVALEQDLLLNLTNPRSWNAYIDHVLTQNRPSDREPFFRDADPSLSSAQVRLLGPLASASNRLALQRIAFAYERALATFPLSYTLWKDYLLHRMRYILGEPSGNLDAYWRKQIQTGKEKLDVGPTLLDDQQNAGQNQWDWGLATGSLEPLDGRIGYAEWASLCAIFERALMYLPKMPRIWLLYFTVLMHPSCPSTLSQTHSRRTFDRALRTLPPSLHLRVWKSYLRWAQNRNAETCARVWRRYLKVDPSLTERYVRILQDFADAREANEEEEDEEHGEEEEADTDRILEASKLLLTLAKNAIEGSYISPDEKSPYQLLVEWLELCERHAETVGAPPDEDARAESNDKFSFTAEMLDSLDRTRLPVAHIVRTLGLVRFPDQAGRLWTGLATYWIRRGDLDAAKATFEEGMAVVVTVRDFTQIFDAYAETSENIMGYMMDELAQEEDGDEEEDDRDAKEVELDVRMKEFEELMERRPFLVNEVMLRRNVNDVQEWEKRVSLYGEDTAKVIDTYTKAMETINPRKATSNFHMLCINFARFNEQRRDKDLAEGLDAARDVLEKATTIPFTRVDDLAEIWCEWAELEVRHGNFDGALSVMERATVAPKTSAAVKAISFLDDTLTSQKRLFKSSKLWTFFIDLQEGVGTIDGARQTYDRMIELKIATPQVIINYARFLEENKFFEDAFKVYERGVDVFTYPVAFEIWNIYLSKFIKRYGAGKLERARDMFEQALEKCPDKYCRPLFLTYGKLEEDFGLAKRAMNIYERATERVPKEDKMNMYIFYIAKVTANFGLAATRTVYERAIEVLPDRQTAEMCVRFAQMEQKLGEVDRARALYGHASQFCDPRTEKTFWSTWNAFEIEHGSEDTFREMLRIRRSVQAQFNTDTSYIAAYTNAQQKANATSQHLATQDDDPMARAEREAALLASSSSSSFKPSERSNGKISGFVAASNPDTPQPPAPTTINTEVLGGGRTDGDGEEQDDDEDLM